jgi:hypothetical protein
MVKEEGLLTASHWFLSMTSRIMCCQNGDVLCSLAIIHHEMMPLFFEGARWNGMASIFGSGESNNDAVFHPPKFFDNDILCSLFCLVAAE